MAADVNKHLDRAKRFLEKNRVEDAIEAYLAVLGEAPQHQEATQALGDLYARIDQADRAAVYYEIGRASCRERGQVSARAVTRKQQHMQAPAHDLTAIYSVQ